MLYIQRYIKCHNIEINYGIYWCNVIEKICLSVCLSIHSVYTHWDQVSWCIVTLSILWALILLQSYNVTMKVWMGIPYQNIHTSMQLYCSRRGVSLDFNLHPFPSQEPSHFLVRMTLSSLVINLNCMEWNHLISWNSKHLNGWKWIEEHGLKRAKQQILIIIIKTDFCNVKKNNESIMFPFWMQLKWIKKVNKKLSDVRKYL